jgi:hypothetical protein
MTRHDVGFFVVGVRVVGLFVGVGADDMGALLGLAVGVDVIGNSLWLAVGADVVGDLLGLADGLAVAGLDITR